MRYPTYSFLAFLHRFFLPPWAFIELVLMNSHNIFPRSKQNAMLMLNGRKKLSGAGQTIVSNSLAYPMVFSITCPLATRISSVRASSCCCGKYILPSLATQPLPCANSTTLPSLSRNSRFLALAMGSEGYAFSEHEAISSRIVPTSTFVQPLVYASTYTPMTLGNV